MHDSIDVFNGDADGLIARHMYRLAHPAPATLVTGVKRDIALLARILPGRSGLRIAVFDISFDRNADAARDLLAAGASITWFDHHAAGRLQPHPCLDADIDLDAATCSSLIVDRRLGGRYRDWAIAAAFGDNLHAVASEMASARGLDDAQTTQLRRLGECLNYNAYGRTVADLHHGPADLAARMAPHADPFDFIARDDLLDGLDAARAADLAQGFAAPRTMGAASTLVTLPDLPWAHRVSGALANLLVDADPGRAHAVATMTGDGACTVSLRAPLARPEGAAAVAAAFGGNGRARAAGIDNFPASRLGELAAALERAYGGTAGPAGPVRMPA